MYVEVYGDPFAERIVFHQEDLLQPWKSEPLEAPQIASVLPEVRRLILAGEYKKANDLALAKGSEGPWKPFMDTLHPHPAFHMEINTEGQHAVRDYLRSTDFESGEVKVSWADDAGRWERRTFVSRPDNVVVQRLTAPNGSGINAKVQLDTSMILSEIATETRPEPGADKIIYERRFDGSHMILTGRYVVAKGHPGYVSVTRVIADGGTVGAEGDSLVVRGVRNLTLITRIEASPELTEGNLQALKAAVDRVAPSYDELLARNRKGQGEVMDRVSTEFGGAEMRSMCGEELLSDQRTRSGYNPVLLSELFDMGRYWLYLRSGKFPPMWGLINVNINMQVSGAVMGNLPESMDSYIHWVESLLPDARTNAKNIFGARGVLFCVHPTQEGDPLTFFHYSSPHEYWVSGGGWLYRLMWDQYLATGDRKLLAEHILPGLKEVATFYEDYLSEKDKNGNFIFVPSFSPENWPSNTDKSGAVINAVMDIAVCREVLTHLIEGSQSLGVNTEDIPRWKGMLAKLPPYLSDTDGALKEWAWPTLEERLNHRHVSHLYGAWPGDEVTPEQTPDLARAVLLAARKRGQEDNSQFGLLFRGLAAARLKDPYLGNFALRQLIEEGYINTSLTTMHNPYSTPAPDAQGGIPTLIMEMLVYSRPGVIELLPAIPESLQQGDLKGVVTRTEATIDDMTWDLDRSTVDVTIHSRVNQTVQLIIRQGIQSVTASPGVLSNAVTPGSTECEVHLDALHPPTLHFTLGKKNRLAWVPQH
jgi:hypothetical protein